MTYTPEQQEHAAAAVTPVFWARLAVRRTCLTCALSCLFPLALLAVVAFTGFAIDNPGASDYVIRNDVRTRLNDARLAARDRFRFVPPVAQPAALQRTRFENDETLSILFRGRVGEGGDVALVSETSADAFNVLTRRGLALMKKAEDDVFDDPQYKSICFKDPAVVDCAGRTAECVLPLSVLSSEHLYGETNELGVVCGRKPGSDQVSESDFQAFLESLIVTDADGTRRVNGSFAGYMGNDFTPESTSTWVTQSTFRIGRPFKGFNSSDDRVEEQDELYSDFAKDVADRIESFTSSQIDVYLIGAALADLSFDTIVFGDLLFSVAAIFLVFIAICIHTSSPFLGATAMFQIFLAFPFSYVIYTYVFQQKYFAALQILVIFLILGIGADDVFVFIDAWKQASVILGANCDLVTRMSWTYRRAVKAMAVTSITTAAAFFVTATSPIMPIGTLGIWAGILILLQFVLVITIFPCATIIWHRFYRVRTITNCFKKPEPGKENEPTPYIWTRCLPSKMRKETNTSTTEDYRLVERFFRGSWVNLLHKSRLLLIALGVILVGLSIWRAILLTPPDESEEFLPSSHPLRVAFTTLQDAFPTSETDFQLRVTITWGILDVDRTGTSRFDPSDPGEAVLDSSFNIRSAAAQKHIFDACDFFQDQKNLIFQENTIKPVECWIRDFKTWREGEGRAEFTNYASDKEFITELVEFSSFTTEDGALPFLGYLRDQHFAFNKARDEIVFTEIRFVSPVEAAVPYKKMWPVYTAWQDQLAILNDRAPDGTNKAIATGGYSWMWQITQRNLVTSMFTGIGIMLAVAVVVLTVSTLNWYIAILATISIGSIVCMLMGFIQLIGWQLGITESIGVVIAVGYSFDGAAHIATAYVESKSEDRFGRTRDALTDLGISILFGAISTLLAGFMLFPAVIIFFVKFAGLIVTTVTLGLIWSLMFFPALLLTIGPAGSFGDLKPFLRKVFGKLRKNRNVDSVSDQREAEVEKIADESPPEESDASMNRS